MGRGSEPRWLSRVVIDAVHDDQVREHGGLAGIRDEHALESIIARPRQKWHDGAQPDLPTLAAASAYGLVTGHPYRDGNKRIGFLAMLVFLDINGHDVEATEADVVTEFLALADGRVSEEALTDWIRRRSSKRR